MNELSIIESNMMSSHANVRTFGRTIGGVNPNMYQIPVVVKNFYDGNNAKIPEPEIERYLNYVNKLYQMNGLYIRLYLKKIIDINDVDKNYVNSSLEANNIMNDQYHDNALNIALVRDGDEFGGIAHPPQAPLVKKYTCVVKSEFARIDNNNASTLVHEVGHTLGLSHTHDKGNFIKNKCNQEPVSRTQKAPITCLNIFHITKPLCEYRGDGLCDTDGDPDLSTENLYYDYYCDNYDYLGITIPPLKYDAWGNPWLQSPRDNALRNIMGYNAYKHTCRREFTNMQKAIMYKGTKNHGPALNNSNETYFYTNTDVDIFENDNFWKENNDNNDYFYESYFDNDFSSAIFNGNNKIDINTQQYHTFHLSPTSSGGYEAKDIDWVYFQNSSGSAKDFIIQTMEVSGKPKPDTKITLYPIDSWDGTLGTAIATHDDISSSNKFSKITINLAAYSYYAVKIENNITSTSDSRSKGHYYISVDECYEKSNIQLQASGYVCSIAKTATLLNPPTGSTYSIQWSAVNLTLIGSTTSTSVNYKRSTPGTGKLIVTINSSNGCIPYVLEKTINTRTPDNLVLVSPFGINSTCDFGLEEFNFPIELDKGTQATFSVTYLDAADQDIVDIEWAFDCGSVVSEQLFTTFLGLRSDLKVNVSGSFCGELKSRPVNSCGEKGAWKVKDLVFTTTPCSGGGWSLRVAPNPSQNDIRFELDEEKLSLYKSKYLEETIQIIITDAQGNVSYSDKRKYGDNFINIGKLKAGLYNLTVIIGEQVMNAKFTKIE